MIDWYWKRGILALILAPILILLSHCPAHAQATIGWNRGPWAAAGRIPDTNTYSSSGFVLVASTSAGSTDSQNVTTPAIDTTGATLIVVHIGWYADQPVAFSDSKGNTCTGLTAQNYPTIISGQLFVCYAPTVGAGHTFSASVSYAPSIEVLAFSGPSATTDQQNGTTIYEQTTQPGSVTPTNANELIVTGLVNEDNSSGAISISGGFSAVTVPYSVGLAEGSAIAYKVQTAATAENPTWDVTTATYLAVTMVTITP